ncbi:hypothetical protein J421_4814 (plasmid) [Gemmatirosa kalamazoonensis]|uniref:DUF2306 domain-containing protein n=1 Tax=Gemmatirosa kalamazoonensis TaxID=861299 RepID=W0RMT0_9BACT|nr:hypothetical protein [Gemmatirosa kalamazoonensis]AHG92349.1 hypothetical protein J421_4814 [Gemmatirosa kalamazoonensis]
MMAVLAGPRVTLGSGGWSVQAPLLLHVTAGMVAIVTGYVALYAAKGAGLHRRSGTLFVYAMLAMALVGAAIAAYEGKIGSVNGGLLTAYMVTTALLTVRPPTVASRRVELGGMLVAFATGAANLSRGFDAAAHGLRARDGVPVRVFFIFGAIALACGIADARMLRRGGVRGTARLIRHLWRIALFIAAGSFFLGQAKVIPKPLRVPELLAVPALLPLVVMLWWLWRVRVRRWIPRLRPARVVEAPVT